LGLIRSDLAVTMATSSGRSTAEAAAVAEATPISLRVRCG